MALKFTDENFEEEVLKSSQLIIVDLYADWCGPCKMLGPVIEQLAQEYEGKVKIGKLNVDESPAIAQKYGVMTIPTVLFFKNGEVVHKIVGVERKETFEEKIAELR
ncbi:thioredoxin [[Clostridium] polysaccharolyticum]|uniref:Thioredoxin n=1 Tax=[Clostridium] polysaccharolyticum TaxID=29364 RepID=A0A1I0D6T6_9FIRM|nr:thioredoxin [[Clostridium] polysaccharolyticum]SET27930.1 thioredoxin [[Clostridium] polysaccharolyticum]